MLEDTQNDSSEDLLSPNNYKSHSHCVTFENNMENSFAEIPELDQE
jgi:hypothetical protein